MSCVTISSEMILHSAVYFQHIEVRFLREITPITRSIHTLINNCRISKYFI